MKLKSIKIDMILIPKFNRNRELPANEQVKIHFSKIPGRIERESFVGFKMDKRQGLEMIHNDHMLVLTYVERIENLSDEIGDLTVQIKTGAQLAESSNADLDKLFVEIREHLFPENEDLTMGESKA